MEKQTPALTVIVIIALLCVTYIGSQKHEQGDIDYMDVIDTLVDSSVSSESSHLQERLLDQRSLVLSKEVNQISSERIISSLILLNSQDQEKEINLYLLTGGGWLGDAFGIINTMNEIEAPVNTIAMSDVSSAGAVILAGGTGNRIGYQNSIIMVHANRERGVGEYNWESLDFERFSSFWKEHSNIPEEWTEIERDESFYLSADQALAFGVIDQIAEKSNNKRSSRAEARSSGLNDD